MGFGNHHHCPNGHTAQKPAIGERPLLIAVILNIALTAVQVAGGLLSGSLSLLADALHNFSDAASLLIAFIAIQIGKRPPDIHRNFGYKRAETVAALINLTTLVLIGLYLIGEGVGRLITPQPVAGWMVIGVAAFALAVDVATAALTFKGAKNSFNLRAVFLHNLTDALASVGVIIAGTLILLYGWLWTDAAMTFLIAGYVLYQGASSMPQVINLLMEGVPKGLNIPDIVKAMEAVEDVDNVHHVHVWQVDEQTIALEAHVKLKDLKAMEAVKYELKEILFTRGITRSTLEFEWGEVGQDRWH